MHADHITGTGYLKQLIPNVKSLISKSSGANADQHLNDGDIVQFGQHQIKAISTPGHTNGCMTFINHKQVRCVQIANGEWNKFFAITIFPHKSHTKCNFQKQKKSTMATAIEFYRIFP